MICFVQIDVHGQLETPCLLINMPNVGKVADVLVTYMLKQNPATSITTETFNPFVCKCND
jgi:D-aminopeptidase